MIGPCKRQLCLARELESDRDLYLAAPTFKTRLSTRQCGVPQFYCGMQRIGELVDFWYSNLRIFDWLFHIPIKPSDPVFHRSNYRCKLNLLHCNLKSFNQQLTYIYISTLYSLSFTLLYRNPDYLNQKRHKRKLFANSGSGPFRRTILIPRNNLNCQQAKVAKTIL